MEARHPPRSAPRCASPSDPPGESPPVKLETAAKISAAVVAGSYVVGLLTVSSYLYRNGAVLEDPTAFRGRFIYTGATVLSVILVSTAALSFALTLWGFRPVGTLIAPDLYERDRRPSHRGWAVVIALLPTLLLALILHLAGNVSWTSNLFWDAFGLSASGAVGGLAALVGLNVVFGVRARLARWMTAVGLLCYGVAFLIFMIAFSAQSLYPRIPQQFGGGRSQPTELLFTSATRQAAIQLGLPMIPGSNLSANLHVLFTSSQYTLVRLPNGHVVQLDKSLIKGAIGNSGGD